MAWVVLFQYHPLVLLLIENICICETETDDVLYIIEFGDEE